jgi:hypothetical protein
MFDSMVASVLGYGSEVWGYVNGDDVEIVHNTFVSHISALTQLIKSLFPQSIH